MTHDKINYQPYEKVAHDFPDIEIKAFQQAVRLIEPDGRVFSGAEAALRTFQYGTRWNRVYPLYVNKKWFRAVCNSAYDWIAKHRQFMHKLSVALFGSNPENLRHYWILYLLGLVALIVVLAVVL